MIGLPDVTEPKCLVRLIGVVSQQRRGSHLAGNLGRSSQLVQEDVQQRSGGVICGTVFVELPSGSIQWSHCGSELCCTLAGIFGQVVNNRLGLLGGPQMDAMCVRSDCIEDSFDVRYDEHVVRKRSRQLPEENPFIC